MSGHLIEQPRAPPPSLSHCIYSSSVSCSLSPASLLPPSLFSFTCQHPHLSFTPLLFLFSLSPHRPALTLQPPGIIHCAILAISVRLIVLPCTPVSSLCISINWIFHRCVKSAWCGGLPLSLLFALIPVWVQWSSFTLSLYRPSQLQPMERLLEL